MALSLVAAVSRIDHPVVSHGQAGLVSAEPVWQFAELMSSALAHDPSGGRLAEAGIVVRIDFVDAPDAVLTLLLDRCPAACVAGTAPDWPAVRLWMPVHALTSFDRDGSYLPLRIVSGEVRFQGVVRKLFRVVPILRLALL